MTYTPEQLRVLDRITEYLSGGGLFNPECANHDAVRDLLIDAREAHAAALEEVARLRREAGAYRKDMILANDRAERAESALADAKEKNGELHMVNRELHRQLAEAERKGERLKFHAEAMAHYTDCYKDKWPDSGARQALEEYRAEFKE